ncbi:tripartite tricarboxylate transporter substrate binding protein [Pigmentiphaga soli]|uniref:Tripartite tricarboxylate transporter substrate binding protein n=1 Tax=Pigmentiphaga soli TaxID=1007095 RepID=A0ABP8GPZ9_9BURK
MEAAGIGKKTGRALAAAAMFLCASLAAAQPAAEGPIKFVIITAAGGASDQIARLIGERLTTLTGRTVLVENRPGAGGNIATQFVARAHPDGATFLVTSNNHTINPFIYKEAGYDPERDLMPVIQLGAGPSVLAVHPSVPARTLKEFVALSKRKPGSLSYASTGLGSASSLAGELLKVSSGLDMEHIPYKGGAEAITAVLGGQVPAIVTSLTSAGPHIKSGKLRPLAVATPQRWPGDPDIPTMAESGWPDCKYEVWQGLLAPRGTPAAVIEKMNADVGRVLAMPDVKERFMTLGYRPVGGTTEAFRKMLAEDRTQVAQIVKRVNMHAD